MAICFSCLPEHVLIGVLLYLELKDVARFRQTCHELHRIAKAKIVWLSICYSLHSEGEISVPPYIKSLDSLDGSQIEALILRIGTFQHLLKGEALSPKQVVHLDMALSVTWLRLVHGRWLFTASSDNYLSKFTCFDISRVYQGSSEAIAECFLPGPVNSGYVEVQPRGVVIALGLGFPSPSIQVLVLCCQKGQYFFSEVIRFPGLSHVRFLDGKFIGCVLRGDVNIPRLINWETRDEHELSFIPRHEGAPLIITIWLDFVVLFGRHNIRISTLPSVAKGSKLLHTFALSDFIWEASLLSEHAVCLANLGEESLETHPGSSIHFMAVSGAGFQKFTVSVDALSNSAKLNFTMATSLTHTPPLSYRHNWEAPWYRLSSGTTGRRLLWINGKETAPRDDFRQKLPYLVSAPSDMCTQDARTSDNRQTELKTDTIALALWAYSQIEFDESLGLVAIGNVFGELALIDYVGFRCDDIWTVSKPVTAQDSHDRQPAITHPLPLDLPIQLPRRPGLTTAVPYDSSPELAESLRSKYSLPNDVETKRWLTDWLEWHWWDLWQGNIGDHAWLVEHAFGYLGQPKLIAFNQRWPEILFEIGGLYFIMDHGNDYMLISFRHGTLIEDIIDEESYRLRTVSQTTWQGRITAFMEREMFNYFWREENEVMGRNRYVEQKERGGRPPAILLTMLPPKEEFRPLTPEGWDHWQIPLED